MNINVLVLTKYGYLGASSRLRFYQYLPLFESAGLHCDVKPLLSDMLLMGRYTSGVYVPLKLLHAYAGRLSDLMHRKQFGLMWIEKEALPWWPLWLELGLLRGMPYVLDYDDAIFHNYDQHANSCVRWVYGRRLDTLMSQASWVVAGNNYLAQRAIDAGAARVEIVPTVIDLVRYPTPCRMLNMLPDDRLPRIVWIGSPSTVRYLQLIRGPLQAIAARQPFVLRVIGGGAVDMPGVQVEVVPWAENTEVENIRTCQIGIMPLEDSPWARGKCGYKLIQYMACGLPVVASGIGVNSEIVRSGENGFLAGTPQEWVDALCMLLADASLRATVGVAGRLSVESEYCMQKTGPRMAKLLQLAAGGK